MRKWKKYPLYFFDLIKRKIPHIFPFFPTNKFQKSSQLIRLFGTIRLFGSLEYAQGHLSMWNFRALCTYVCKHVFVHCRGRVRGGESTTWTVEGLNIWGLQIIIPGVFKEQVLLLYLAKSWVAPALRPPPVPLPLLFYPTKIDQKSTSSWPLASKLHHWGHATVVFQ